MKKKKEAKRTKKVMAFPLRNSFRVFREFYQGFRFISRIDKAASFFGSARESLPSRFYADCEELATRLSRKGFAVITGGGGGIMQAANKGAYYAKGGGLSVGVSISIPQEQEQNEFVDHARRFRYFFSRKTILSCASELYIFFPGGFGTLDELFEMLTMIQTKHSVPVPILLYGEEYWTPLVSFIREQLAEEYKTINKTDTRLFVVVDTVDEAERCVEILGIEDVRSCKTGSILP